MRFGAAKASIFQVSSPLFTAFMAWLLLGERLTVVVATGMAMTIGELMLASYKPGFFSLRSAAPEAVLVAKPVEQRWTLRQPARDSPWSRQHCIAAGCNRLFCWVGVAHWAARLLTGCAAMLSWPEPIPCALSGA